MNVYEIKNTSVCVMMQYFRELQSLLQQFIIVEHAVDPAVEPSAEASADQQQTMDQAALESVKHESQALAADELAAQTDAAVAADMAPAEAADMAMMETSAEASASSADNQMAFEQDQQPSTEAFVAEETGPSDIAWYISVDWSSGGFRECCITDSECDRRALLLVDKRCVLSLCSVNVLCCTYRQQRGCLADQPCCSQRTAFIYDLFPTCLTNLVGLIHYSLVKQLVERKGFFLVSTRELLNAD